jgi:hypothetical protein
MTEIRALRPTGYGKYGMARYGGFFRVSQLLSTGRSAGEN